MYIYLSKTLRGMKLHSKYFGYFYGLYKYLFKTFDLKKFYLKLMYNNLIANNIINWFIRKKKSKINLLSHYNINKNM